MLCSPGATSISYSACESNTRRGSAIARPSLVGDEGRRQPALAVDVHGDLPVLEVVLEIEPSFVPAAVPEPPRTPPANRAPAPATAGPRPRVDAFLVAAGVGKGIGSRSRAEVAGSGQARIPWTSRGRFRRPGGSAAAGTGSVPSPPLRGRRDRLDRGGTTGVDAAAPAPAARRSGSRGGLVRGLQPDRLRQLALGVRQLPCGTPADPPGSAARGLRRNRGTGPGRDRRSPRSRHGIRSRRLRAAAAHEEHQEDDPANHRQQRHTVKAIHGSEPWRWTPPTGGCGARAVEAPDGSRMPAR